MKTYLVGGAVRDRLLSLPVKERDWVVIGATEQEMLAAVQENRAKVVLAEVEIPKAISESFRKGNLGIMDYYRMKNIQADTSMRNSIGGDLKDKGEDNK